MYTSFSSHTHARTHMRDSYTGVVSTLTIEISNSGYESLEVNMSILMMFRTIAVCVKIFLETTRTRAARVIE